MDTLQDRAITTVTELLLGNWPMAEMVVRAVLDEARAQSIWQPIETAPMVERVARAMAGGDRIWDRLPNDYDAAVAVDARHHKQEFRHYARVAIEVHNAALAEAGYVIIGPSDEESN